MQWNNFLKGKLVDNEKEKYCSSFYDGHFFMTSNQSKYHYEISSISFFGSKLNDESNFYSVNSRYVLKQAMLNRGNLVVKGILLLTKFFWIFRTLFCIFIQSRFLCWSIGNTEDVLYLYQYWYHLESVHHMSV